MVSRGSGSHNYATVRTLASAATNKVITTHTVSCSRLFHEETATTILTIEIIKSLEANIWYTTHQPNSQNLSSRHALN